jgi:hypothetical protein
MCFLILSSCLCRRKYPKKIVSIKTGHIRAVEIPWEVVKQRSCVAKHSLGDVHALSKDFA